MWGERRCTSSVVSVEMSVCLPVLVESTSALMKSRTDRGRLGGLTERERLSAIVTTGLWSVGRERGRRGGPSP